MLCANVTSCEATTSCLMKMLHLVLYIIMEIMISMGNFGILHEKHCILSHVSMCVQMKIPLDSTMALYHFVPELLVEGG